MARGVSKSLPGMTDEEFSLLEERSSVPPELWAILSHRQRQLWVIRMSRPKPLTLRELAQVSGLSLANVTQMWQAIRDKCKREGVHMPSLRSDKSADGTSLPSGRIATETFLRGIEPALHKVIQELGDRGKIKKANLRDLAQAASKLTEIRALMSGEPTQIIAHEQRQGMNELAQMLVDELRKRGMEYKGVDPRSGDPRIEKNVTPKAAAL